MIYRNDIDGLRALAVIAVLIYHLGYLPYGYLGVDIFFVISGFLITKINYLESIHNNFSLLKFYERRIRRILPLLFLVTSVSLIAGIILLLPQDLVALSKSVIASNFSFNNILMYLTSGGYWETGNNFKPLMHTWSLGIEEQFYLFYPLIFMFSTRFGTKYIGLIIGILSILSLIFFFLQPDITGKFFLIQYRFYELSVGGLAAIFLSGKLRSTPSINIVQIVIVFLLLLILAGLFKFSNEVLIVLTIIFTVIILLFGEILSTKKSWYFKIFTNPTITFIGKISFSLYMWHQPIFAFARMTVVREMTPVWAVVLTAITVLMSIISFYFVENYFRDKKKVSLQALTTTLFLVLSLSSATSLYLIFRGGVVRDIEILDITSQQNQISANFSPKSNILLNYNNRIFNLHKNFNSSTKKRILVIGDSFARDASNILLESGYQYKMEVRYIDFKDLYTANINKDLLTKAEHIVFSFDNFESKTIINDIEERWKVNLNPNAVTFFGTKNFGSNFHAGYDYFQSRFFYDWTGQYYSQTNQAVLAKNIKLKREWGDQYIDLIAPLIKSGTTDQIMR